MNECIQCNEQHVGDDAEYCPPCLVRLLRADLVDARQEVVLFEVVLKAAERAAGCRSGDGSDQPGLFDVVAPGLF